MVTRDQLKWTKEDDLAIEEYKRKLEAGEISTISFDTFKTFIGKPKRHRMTAYFDSHRHSIDVCCEALANTKLEYICKEDNTWWAGGEGQHHYQMKFCPYCGTRLP